MSGGRVLLSVNRRLERELREMGGSTKPEMLETAKLLKQALRKRLGVKGRGKPSKPGESPREQSGGLRKSVVSGAVGAAQRVGLTKFTAPILEFGLDTKADGATPRSRRDLFSGALRAVKKGSARAAARRQERRNAGGSPKVRHERIEARPFMQQALEDVGLDRLVDVQVNAIRRRLPGG